MTVPATISAPRAKHDAARIFIASNRLPVTAVRDGSTVRFRRSDGGLAAGLRHIARASTVRWYGWCGMSSDANTPEQLEMRRGAALVSIPVNSEELTGFYRDYCNSLLWPALHGMSDYAVCSPNAWQKYVQINKRFADAMLNDLKTHDRVWIHDYHLLMLPEMLRINGSSTQTSIAFFLHTPFPSFDEFVQIPQHRELIRGMLGSDVIGFHTEEYAENFLGTARALGHRVEGNSVIVDQRAVYVSVRPMGIDADAFVRLGSDPDILEQAARLRSNYKRILLGVDRLDYTKGIPQRLLAFERLLQDRPELKGEISLLQLAVPSRTENSAYRDLREVVEKIVDRINRVFGTSAWTPVEYLYDSVDLNTLASLYRAADVMLVTPARDGLNLVAKEFVATRVDGDGVLVLSKYAGAAKELTSALFVDPNKIRDLADALYRAVTMSLNERRSRMSHMMKAVMANGIGDWTQHFVGEPGKPKVATSLTYQ